MKNKAQGNETKMAILASRLSAECCIFCLARARQCFNFYREFPLQIRAPP